MYLCGQIMEYEIIHIDETDSTNGWLRRNLATDGHKQLVVMADFQTAGKGCGSNSWESERGKNLTFSVLLHPTEIKASWQFRISEAVSVALCETLEHYFCPPCPANSSPRIGQLSIKWPNDIYVDDRKICGILIENRLQGSTITDCIVGIGLNVNQTMFYSDAPNPVSMAQVLGRETDRDELLKVFLKVLPEALKREPEVLVSDYHSRLYRREGMHRFCDDKGVFEAKVQNVLDDGRLVLLDTDGRARIYAFKEVGFCL